MFLSIFLTKMISPFHSSTVISFGNLHHPHICLLKRGWCFLQKKPGIIVYITNINITNYDTKSPVKELNISFDIFL